MSGQNSIYVFAHWAGMSDPVLIGMLSSVTTAQKEIFSFEYDEGWLKHHAHHTLDPHLLHYGGKFFPASGSDNFGLFIDSSPGSWGRMLMKRMNATAGRKEKREAELSSSNYLLNVFDYYRSGALRFKTSPEGEFVTSDEQFLLPSMASLRDLEQYCLICETSNVNDLDSIRALEMLSPPGAALSGKRPKANVIDDEWQMWLAKFPSVHDQHDVGAWEYVAHTLAGLAGIQTATAMMKRYTSHHHTFISQRFDRTVRGERIHFASALTLLGYRDEVSARGSGYLELVEFIVRNGANVNGDLEELWRRIVFNIAISNTDDHLRNHGFLLTQNGWILSPAFDMNPEIRVAGLALNISEKDNSLDFDLALSVAKYFRVKPDKAKSILQEVKIAAMQWDKVASDAGVTKAELEKMRGAFEAYAE